MIQLKTDAEVTRMRSAGLVVAETLSALRSVVTPGVTPQDLNALAEREIRARGAVPSFLGYYGFPATICASVNDEIVHSIPNGRPLREGDVISIDCGAVLDGWHGDAAISVPVGAVPEHVSRLLEVCEDALWAGIGAMVAGGRLRDIGTAVERCVRAGGDYGLVEEYGGHGIGTEMHQDPQVLNYRTRAKGPRLTPGLVLAVEPMITLGRPETVLADDRWTVRTRDGSLAAHYEHSIAITADGPWVLTAIDGGAGRLSERGIPTSAAGSC